MKPHLIVHPWRYLCPKKKKWLTEENMKCEPRMDGGTYRKSELLMTQLRAMGGVISAMDEENASLRDRIRATKSLTPAEQDLKKLNEEYKSLNSRKSELVKRLKELEQVKRKCKELAEAKAKLESDSRLILAKIESKENTLKKYEAGCRQDQDSQEGPHSPDLENRQSHENGIQVEEYCGEDSD